MAALKEVIKDNKIDLESGIPWVAIWKKGRSWYGEAFWNEDGENYFDGGFEVLKRGGFEIKRKATLID